MQTLWFLLEWSGLESCKVIWRSWRNYPQMGLHKCLRPFSRIMFDFKRKKRLYWLHIFLHLVKEVLFTVSSCRGLKINPGKNGESWYQWVRAFLTMLHLSALYSQPRVCKCTSNCLLSFLNFLSSFVKYSGENGPNNQAERQKFTLVFHEIKIS